MAQDITLLGATYSDVPAVDLPKSGGGMARFLDSTEYRTASEQDVIDATKLGKTETAHRTSAIYYGQVDSTSTSTVFTAQIEGITEYYDGLLILLRNGVVTSASGFTININSIGAKPVYNNMAMGNPVTPTAPTRETTVFNINYAMMFIYNSTLVDGGCFLLYRGYWSDANSIGYQLRTNSTVMTVTDSARYYKMYFTSADGTQWVPASVNSKNDATTARAVNQRPINPFGRIVYTSASTNYTAGSNLAAGTVWDRYSLVLGYSFNVNGGALTLTSKKPVYLKCAPQNDGSAIMDATTPIVQDLPNTEDGKIYIWLGVAYDATHIELHEVHPIYYYKSSAIRLWTNALSGGGGGGGAVDSVNGQTGIVVLDANDVGALPDNTVIPSKTSDLTNDSGYITGMYIASYGNSTYADVLAAYQANKVVYCRASSNANPGTGNQLRMAFLAYVNDTTTPTEFEFQYYRSVATHSATQQGDQVFVYKLKSASGWEVTTREAYTKIVAGTGLTSSYSNGVLTISLA